MILVLTVLGLLFVTGVAFMATMNFEATIVSAEKGRDKAGTDASRLVSAARSLLDPLPTPSTGGANLNLAGASLPVGSYVDLPGYHNLSAPIEPVRMSDTGPMVFPWSTDAKALLSTSFQGSQMRGTVQYDPETDPIDTATPPGTQPDLGGFPNKQNLMYLDADGDGISDSLGFELTPESFPGVNRREFAELARLVNAPTNPDGKVFLGLRMLNHSGLVNVNASSPSLIRNVLGGLSAPEKHGRYSTTIEEPSLRRRFMLLPAELPPTQLLGNPFSRDAQLGMGDFASVLMKWPDSPREPRYWPYRPDEFGKDPGFPLWVILMDADKADPLDPAADSYDRRHLITTVSHDDLLARPTTVPVPNASGTGVEFKDLVDHLIAEQAKLIDDARNSGANLLQFKCELFDRFSILKYPFAPNAFRVAPATPPNMEDELCDCLKAGGDCTVNPRNGRMKLSLPWLKEMLTPPQGQAFGAITLFEGDDVQNPRKPAAADLLQSSFTMLLYNARGTAWGIDNPSPNPNDFDFGLISATAASLTANFIDYFDGDDQLSGVQRRSAQYYKGPGQSAIPLGEKLTNSYSYGLERQPYITEVVVELIDDPPVEDFYDPTGDGWALAIEMFYPQTIGPTQIFHLKINDEIVQLGQPAQAADSFRTVLLVNRTDFVPTFSDARFGPPLTPQSPVAIEKKNNEYEVDVEIVQSTDFGYVAVDQFTMRFPSSGVYRDAREVGASALDRWFAPLPATSGVQLLPNGADAKKTLGYGAFVDVNLLKIHRVEAVQANTDDITTAFPTTGSMLALMRVSHDSTGRPFTARLDGPIGTFGYPIDNGRMPLFDLANQHRLDPASSTVDRLADKDYLPWGQLVFDYFTALPLSNENPYRLYEKNINEGTMPPNQAFAELERALPQVDEEGMRVHGRVNLNIAPWKVLEGLTFQPYNVFPGEGKGGVADAVKRTVEDVTGNPPVPLAKDEVRPIGEGLAKAIVAYRELRPLLVSSSGGTTQDYSTQRGWDLPSQSVPQPPVLRRGMGLMTVGELANVRHPLAGDQVRFDGSTVKEDQFGQSFLEAAGPLMALSEWATVRSHVFTMYGVLRGETWENEDEALTASKQDRENALRNADSRALRFQETVDRMPTLLGDGGLRRIGDRVTGRYVDARGN